MAQSSAETDRAVWGCFGYALGSVGNLLVSTSRVALTADAFEMSRSLCAELIARYPRGIAQLVIAEPGSPMPSPEARERIRSLNETYKKQILAMAMVLPGQGLWSASMRMVGNTMMMVIAAPYPRKLHGSVGDGAKWLEQELGGRASFRSLEVMDVVGDLERIRTRRCADCSCPKA